MSARVVAVDWSGAKVGAARKIWLAEAQEGQLLRLEGGRDRGQIVDHLIEMCGGRGLVVGLDFGFSTPAWYLEKLGFGSAPQLWRWLAEKGCADRLLSQCARPLWGRPGIHRHSDVEHFRRTERTVAAAERVQPKSVFQIGGAGAVGTGSLRGMCALHQLREAGFAIWPFDDAADATVIEIYPRLFTGPVKKRRPDCREDVLRHRYPEVSGDLFDAAASSEDAFDAAVSAIEMSKFAEDLESLPSVNHAELRIEGVIWWSAWKACPNG